MRFIISSFSAFDSRSNPPGLVTQPFVFFEPALKFAILVSASHLGHLLCLRPHSDTLNYSLILRTLYLVPFIYISINFFDEKRIVWRNKKTFVRHGEIFRLRCPTEGGVRKGISGASSFPSPPYVNDFRTNVPPEKGNTG